MQKMKVFQEFTDSGIRYKTSKYAPEKYDMSFTLKNADFAEILITKNHRLEDKFASGLQRVNATYTNRRARILYRNPQKIHSCLFLLHYPAVFDRVPVPFEYRGGLQKNQ